MSSFYVNHFHNKKDYYYYCLEQNKQTTTKSKMLPRFILRCFGHIVGRFRLVFSDDTRTFRFYDKIFLCWDFRWSRCTRFLRSFLGGIDSIIFFRFGLLSTFLVPAKKKIFRDLNTKHLSWKYVWFQKGKHFLLFILWFISRKSGLFFFLCLWFDISRFRCNNRLGCYLCDLWAWFINSVIRPEIKYKIMF